MVIFAIHWHESATGSHVSSHPETPSLRPPQPIPLGIPRGPNLSVLLHTLNLYCSSVSHMVIYMFQSYSLKTSHPHLLPHSPKVFSLPLCLFCYLNLGCHHHLSKFHVYALTYSIGVSLSDLLHSV